MVETLCTSGAAAMRAGKYASTDIVNSGSAMTNLITEAEGDLINDTRVNWVAAWPTISGAAIAQSVKSAVAAKAAVKIIMYDPSTFINTAEAATMANVLWAEYDRNVNRLKNADNLTAFGVSFLGST